MENLPLALQISGIGIVALFLVLVVLAGIISLMTKYLVDRPEKEEEDISETPEVSIEEVAPESKNDLKLAAAIALAIYRAQVEMSAVKPVETGAEVNSWRQFKLINRLNQSSNVRRAK